MFLIMKAINFTFYLFLNLKFIFFYLFKKNFQNGKNKKTI